MTWMDLKRYERAAIPRVEMEIVGVGSEDVCCDKKTLLSELLDEAAKKLPQQSNVRWIVRCGDRDIAQLIFDEGCSCTKVLSCENTLAADLSPQKIQCRPEKFAPGEIDIPESKCPGDMVCDGVLAYGADVGRFVFHKERSTVYVLSDLQHIGPSDVSMIYQISKEDYVHLLKLSAKKRIPDIPVSQTMIDACKKRFLCGESAHCYRYRCTSADVDMALADKMMAFCPQCGKKNSGGYCTECGTSLMYQDLRSSCDQERR